MTNGQQHLCIEAGLARVDGRDVPLVVLRADHGRWRRRLVVLGAWTPDEAREVAACLNVAADVAEAGGA